jgi:TolA-binding protein
MTCARYADVDIAERYVLGQLEEPEQATFEEHFFGCDECFASVQVLQQMQTALRGQSPVAAVASNAVSSTNTSGHVAKFDEARTRMAAKAKPASGSSVRGIHPVWWGVAVAATVLLAVMLWQRRTVPEAEAPPVIARETDPSTARPTPAPTPAPPQSQPDRPNQANPNQATPATSPATPRSEPGTAPVRPARDLGTLALFTPPPYLPLQTRGTGDTATQTFAAAMTHYNAKEYQAAADGLRTVTEAQPDAAHAQFFLGISLLALDKPAEARQALDRAVASGKAPFSDEAHFYLAKAALKERDLPRAERELKLAVEREAGPAGEAAKLLREVSALSRRGQ